MSRVYAVCLLLLMSASLGAQGANSRAVIDIDSDWGYTESDATAPHALDTPATRWQSVTLPHTWNALDASEMVRVGQRLRVVAPARPGRLQALKVASSGSGAAGERVHRVRSGETLTGLAKRYRVSVQALREANDLSSGATLKAGATLKIPG